MTDQHRTNLDTVLDEWFDIALASVPAVPSHRVSDMAAIEQRVRDVGHFSVLHWLLDNGVLPRRAYERWRYGELAILDHVWTCAGDELIVELEALTRRAEELGLQPTLQTFFHWRPECADQALTLSADSVLAYRLAQLWRRPEDITQLDLFLDSGADVAEQELRQALGAAHPEDAAAAYDRLCSLAPSHPMLGPYEHLILYLRHMAACPRPDTADIGDEIAGFATEIAPAARQTLGDQAGDYLAHAWRRLAEAAPTAFDPQRPEQHASYAWLQVPDGTAARASIEAIPDYSAHPRLLGRLALALEHEHRPGEALLVWARCCEWAPQDATAMARDWAQPRTRHIVQTFEDEAEGCAPEDFGAWLLLHAPRLAGVAQETDVALPTSDSFRVITELLRVRAAGGNEVPTRQELRQLSPPLLQIYLRGLNTQ